MAKAEGTTESWGELLALPEEEVGDKVVEVAGGFAGRTGDQSLVIADLEPGDYLAVCFVPAGTSVNDDGSFVEGEGPARPT